jgi:hypothetical protein
MGWLKKKPPPSVLRFEQGREGNGVVEDEASPSVLRSSFEQGREGVGWLEEKLPLHLAFRARDGGSGEKLPPPSCV